MFLQSKIFFLKKSKSLNWPFFENYIVLKDKHFLNEVILFKKYILAKQ